MVEIGVKRTEYRRITLHWQKRIFDKKAQIKTVTFSKGYTSKTLTFDVTRIRVGLCPYPGWPGYYYCIDFK
jgi:hypothetical protein